MLLITDSKAAVEGILDLTRIKDIYSNMYMECRELLSQTTKLEWNPRAGSKHADVVGKAGKKASIAFDCRLNFVNPRWNNDCNITNVDRWIPFIEGLATLIPNPHSTMVNFVAGTIRCMYFIKAS